MWLYPAEQAARDVAAALCVSQSSNGLRDRRRRCRICFYSVNGRCSLSFEEFSIRSIPRSSTRPEPQFWKPLPIRLRLAAQDSPGTAQVIGSDTDSMTITAKVTRPSLLLITDCYSRYWRAVAEPGSVQGHYTVMPADYTLMAVALGGRRA